QIELDRAAGEAAGGEGDVDLCAELADGVQLHHVAQQAEALQEDAADVGGKGLAAGAAGDGAAGDLDREVAARLAGEGGEERGLEQDLLDQDGQRLDPVGAVVLGRLVRILV